MTRILVVEDEPGIALGLEDDLKLLLSAGAATAGAGAGARAGAER
jgi:hypothetical protein